jgi:uncharacterized membrane protein YeaQ/YmgE (transglycosylase-associated protein family)
MGSILAPHEVNPNRHRYAGPAEPGAIVSPMLILALIVAGMAVGWLVQLALGRNSQQIDWTMALVAGLAGSFVGGLLASLIAGDGIAVRPSGLIGSLVGALIVTLIWQAIAKRQRAAARQPASKPWQR